MYGYLYMQLGPPQIVNQAHVLPSLILWLYRYSYEPGSLCLIAAFHPFHDTHHQEQIQRSYGNSRAGNAGDESVSYPQKARRLVEMAVHKEDFRRPE